MNYLKIDKCSISNGIGVRIVLWVSGCAHHCPNCHNRETWDSDNGTLFDKKSEQKLFQLLEPDYISGITFSGGDPLGRWNKDTIKLLSETIKRKYPHKTQWLYTGYEWADIVSSDLIQIIKNIDVVIDGKYVDYQRDTSLAFRGSSNQHIIDVQKSLATNSIVLWGDTDDK